MSYQIEDGGGRRWRMKGAWRARLAAQWVRDRCTMLGNRHFWRFDPGVAHGLPRPLVVSLTSYPRRFPTLILTLRDLLNQSIRPDRLILWLAEEDAPLLPASIRKLERYGLHIGACENLRSYNKIIPTLRAWPETYIVTADDDLHYPRDWLRSLVETVDPHRREVLCRRAHRAKFQLDGSLTPYAEWDFDAAHFGPGDVIFPTGMAGVLYPPGAFAAEVLDTEALLELAPNADDVWLCWMTARAGTPQRRVGPPFDQLSWDGTQKRSLKAENVQGGANDAQIAAMSQRYGLWFERPGSRATPTDLPVGESTEATSRAAP